MELARNVGNKISGVREEFSEAFWGSALLIFPEQKSLSLVRALLRDQVPTGKLTGLEEEVLAKVGNVILNACLGTFGNLFREEITTELPQFVRGSCEEVLGVKSAGEDEQSVLMIHVDFNVENQNIGGNVLLAIDVRSLDSLLAKVEQSFALT